MSNSEYLISCDWGTSSFRLYLVRTSDGQILHLIDNGVGIKELNTSWNRSGKPSRLEYFLEYLDLRIYLLAKKAERSLDDLPVLISGMASSSIGMQELPYSTLPFSLSGGDLTYRKIERPEGKNRLIYLCSGLRSEQDVMRGEESQIVGLAEYFGEDECVAIQPGTHSKHIFLQAGAIVDFHTYMTGEFFALLSQHSILKNSLPPGAPAVADWTYFEKGVKSAEKLSLLTAGFHVRTNELLHQVSAESNFHYLSGLLIGSELKVLDRYSPIYLCGGGKLRAPYEKALALLGFRQFQVIESEEVDSAVPRAHLRFLRKLNSISPSN
jgi:2-dehydro-3-deoxygalactonokinase